MKVENQRLVSILRQPSSRLRGHLVVHTTTTTMDLPHQERKQDRSNSLGSDKQTVVPLHTLLPSHQVHIRTINIMVNICFTLTHPLYLIDQPHTLNPSDSVTHHPLYKTIQKKRSLYPIQTFHIDHGRAKRSTEIEVIQAYHCPVSLQGRAKDKAHHCNITTTITQTRYLGIRSGL
jgi:hypothetical protein